MSDKQFLPIAIGQDSFPLLVSGNCYYVDKTPFLNQAFAEDPSEVLIFTRPRRFGKTLLISMFDSFLKINPEKPFDNSKQLELFKGTKILEDKEFCDKFTGQCPVIDITLKLSVIPKLSSLRLKLPLMKRIWMSLQLCYISD